MPGFMFATGIENSYPKVARGLRIDQMEKTGHYKRWKEDLALVADLKIHYLRWGPAIYKTWTGPGQYDWDWTDEVMEEMRRLHIHPILDLLHFGLPDFLGDFQNPEFPEYFAEYAAAFARRYGHSIHYWTPINEILITAVFSAKNGWWNERKKDDESFVRAMIHLCKANVLAMRAILKYDDDAIFIQSESSEYIHPSEPRLMKQADFLNERRFLPLDLTYGHDVSATMYRYLASNGMKDSDYDFFMNQEIRYRCILGTDYYVTNEHLLLPNGTLCGAGEFFGYHVIAKQYYERYQMPIMHTETNIWEQQGSAQWLWKQWNCMLELRRQGVPIVGFTWFSLIDQMDWDTVLREDNHNVNTVGLYDLDRNIREVGRHYKRLIEQWREFLPSGSSALMLV